MKLRALSILILLGAVGCDSDVAGTPGTNACTSKNDISVPGACTLRYSNCADMGEYGVECANDVCTCTSDKGGKVVQGLTDCPDDDEEMNTVCNFSVKYDL